MTLDEKVWGALIIISAASLLTLVAAVGPSGIRELTAKFGKGEAEFSFKHRTAPLEESKILSEAAQENPPEEIKMQLEKLIEAAEKRKEEERAPEDYLTLALNALKDKNFDKGLGLAYSGLNLDPKNKKTQVGLYNGLGILYQGLKSYALAKENYKKALKIDEKAYWVHGNLGNTYYHQKKYDDAKRAYKEALRLNPNSCEAHSNLGVFFYQQKNLPEAELEYREAVRLNPTEPQSHSNLGFLLFDKKQYEEALNHFDMALENEITPDTHAGQAICLSKLGRQEEALSTYKTAVSQNSKYLDLTQMREENVWSEQACEAARELIERL